MPHTDEDTYQEIIKLVNSEFVSNTALSANTLRQILRWKLGERYGQEDNVDWQKYGTVYIPRFKIITSGAISDHHKLLVLL